MDPIGKSGVDGWGELRTIRRPCAHLLDPLEETTHAGTSIPAVRRADHIGITAPDLDEAHRFCVTSWGSWAASTSTGSARFSTTTTG